MTPRPSGTVTFLFTDVEGSTSLLARVGVEEYAELIAAHLEALRAACAAHAGVEVDSQGDSIFVAFARARDAVAAARAAQTALRGSGVEARIGIHTGEPLLTSSGYAGMDVHRAARIAAAGHGGQVLISHATRELLDDDDLLDLGAHRLKDLTRPERIYQLGSTRFPPLKSLNSSSLPEAAHPLVGRVAEQHELAHLIRDARLVTITGAGGTGKTRLALQLAAEMAEEFADGVRFVSLAPLTDPGLVLPALLQALDRKDVDAVAGMSALVVLDNFEHLLGAATDIAHLLRQAPGPTLLVTSRTPLHLSMEIEYALDALPQGAAVELFLDRARAVQRSTKPSDVIDEICRRLDGLPLALELAAARLKLLDPPSLLERLDSRLVLLTHGPADVPERQRTLEATIAWSHDLLTPEARHLFSRLSIFAGSFDLAAAESVVDADLDDLANLVDASLLKSRGDSRFLMLETIREFARNHISAADAESLPRLHALHYLELAERAAPHLTSSEAALWLARLQADHGNLRTALDWCVLESPELVPRFTIALWRFWLVRGYFAEGQASIERALHLAPTPSDHAELLYQLGAIVISRGDTARGRTLFEEALHGFRDEGLRRGEARSLSALGHVATDGGQWERAIGLYEQAAALCREIHDEFGLGGVLGDLATVHLRSGSADRALPLALESLELQRTLGNQQGEALALATAGYAHLAGGELTRACDLLTQSTRIAHRLGYLHGLMYSLNGLGAVAVRGGDIEQASGLFEAAEALRVSIGIDHDPDGDLVSDEREHVAATREHAQPAGDDHVDLELVVSRVLDPGSPSPSPH